MYKISAVGLVVLGSLFLGDAEGRTPRSAAEITAFKRENACPATGLSRGVCPGHQIDHADPICAGGSDTRDNMQWLTTEEHRMKTRSDVRMCRPEKGREKRAKGAALHRIISTTPG